ncbi:MAG: DNA gyrase inhibitor YacG [Myxococcales bacterium]|nr:DNA gyrase inhibitor YacG [Myxococcales bacterium]
MKIVCPTCQKTIDDAPDDFPPRPFCSARCKLIDLGNWFDGSYRMSEPIDALESETSDSGDSKLN